MEEPDEPAIRSLLACEDKPLFVETVKSMRSLGVEWAPRYVLAAARASGDPSRRAVLAWALAAYPTSPEAESALLVLAAKDDSAPVREHAIESLGEFHSERVVRALLDVLAVGSSPERFWALFSLGNIAAPIAAEGVRRCLGDRTAVPGLGMIAEEASWALARIQGEPLVQL